MAGGWSRDGAVQEQIEASVTDEIRRARARLGRGESLQECEDCGEPIAQARRRALPGVRKCVQCQEVVDIEAGAGGIINRRGSKDSQLR